jgi:hypothetical protein
MTLACTAESNMDMNLQLGSLDLCLRKIRGGEIKHRRLRFLTAVIRDENGVRFQQVSKREKRPRPGYLDIRLRAYSASSFFFNFHCNISTACFSETDPQEYANDLLKVAAFSFPCHVLFSPSLPSFLLFFLCVCVASISSKLIAFLWSIDGSLSSFDRTLRLERVGPRPRPGGGP